MKTAKSIAEKYVYGNHDASTDKQEVIDMTADIEQFANQSRWVSVKDSYPEYYEPFLAVCDNIVCIALIQELADGTIAISVNGSYPILFTDAGFTRWQSLPPTE